ncbi:MAG: Plug domain-containing protein, partial [Pseudomonadota bacterium]
MTRQRPRREKRPPNPSGAVIRTLIVVAGGTPLWAGAVQAPEEGPDEDNDAIIVEGQARRGFALTDIEPELSLTESDIAAYGVSNLSELLAILQAETSSGRGRRNEPPVVLINGRRVSGFRELDNYPIETIARVDILPEEVSLQYGFSANQRVI